MGMKKESDDVVDSYYESIKENIIENDSADRIKRKFDSIRDLVLEKNRLYGDAALNPYSVFSKISPADRLRSRIDEKISRYRNHKAGDLESPLVDLVGCLVLLILAEEDERQKTWKV